MIRTAWKISFLPFLPFLSFLLLFLAPLCAVAEEAEASEVTPERVFQEVEVLRAELEVIRQVLGIRPPRQRTFRLQGADERQVFFQAQTLFRKCNSLAREIAAISRQAPAHAPDHAITPSDVLSLLADARKQLGYVREALDIDSPQATPKLERRRTFSDAMHGIIEAGYTANAILSEQPDWPAIYDRTLQMMTYIGGLAGESPAYPALPEHACCKSPEDAYQTLVGAMEASRPLAESAGVNIVRIEPIKRAEGGASPSTVFDLTTTMLSDIAEFTLRLEGADSRPPNYERPARILPSHVYQLALALRTQIDTAGTR